MSKKIAVVLITILAMCTLAGCGNQKFFGDNTYRYAIIALPDGTVVKGELEYWCAYGDNRFHVTVNGQSYFTSTVNIVMMSEMPE